MTTQNGSKSIPEDSEGLLASTALAHVATATPGDERVVVFVRPEHTTQKDS